MTLTSRPLLFDQPNNVGAEVNLRNSFTVVLCCLVYTFTEQLCAAICLLSDDTNPHNRMREIYFVKSENLIQILKTILKISISKTYLKHKVMKFLNQEILLIIVFITIKNVIQILKKILKISISKTYLKNKVMKSLNQEIILIIVFITKKCDPNT